MDNLGSEVLHGWKIFQPASLRAMTACLLGHYWNQKREENKTNLSFYTSQKGLIEFSLNLGQRFVVMLFFIENIYLFFRLDLLMGSYILTDFSLPPPPIFLALPFGTSVITSYVRVKFTDTNGVGLVFSKELNLNIHVFRKADKRKVEEWGKCMKCCRNFHKITVFC